MPASAADSEPGNPWRFSVGWFSSVTYLGKILRDRKDYNCLWFERTGGIRAFVTNSSLRVAKRRDLVDIDSFRRPEILAQGWLVNLAGSTAQCPNWVCAVTSRPFPVGPSPARLPIQ